MLLCNGTADTVKPMNSRTYSELISLLTFQERFKYLQIKSSVGTETFGFDRYLNQILYSSQEWKILRNRIIVRDNGCDLGCEGYEIHGRILGISVLDPILDLTFAIVTASFPLFFLQYAYKLPCSF